VRENVLTTTIVAHFQDADQAQDALSDLERQGFTADQVSYVAHDGSGRFADRLRGKNLFGSRAATGALVGGASGTLLAFAALAVPGIGPLIAAGPLAAALTGAGVGAATGSLLGALGDIGVPESEARRYAEYVEQGGSLVAVRVNEDTANRAVQVLHDHHPETIQQHEPAVKETGVEFDPADPHSSAPNYGDEGGSSQWGQTVLRVENGEERVQERTRSRDVPPGNRDS